MESKGACYIVITGLCLVNVKINPYARQTVVCKADLKEVDIVYVTRNGWIFSKLF